MLHHLYLEWLALCWNRLEVSFFPAEITVDLALTDLSLYCGGPLPPADPPELDAYCAGNAEIERAGCPSAAAHEECERLQRQIVRDFKGDVKGHREKLAQGHRVRKMLNELQTQSQKLVTGCLKIPLQFTQAFAPA